MTRGASVEESKMKEASGDETLVRLSEVDDLEIADDDVNPTGWAVYAGDDAIGYVTDLLVDDAAMKVRYLEVQPGDTRERRGNAQVHVPVERVRFSKDTRSVELLGNEQSGAGRVTGLEEFAHLSTPSDADIEPPATGGRSSDDTAAARVTRSEEELRVGTREIQAGEVVVQKSVETEHVREPVTTRVERVRVERRPVGASVAPGEQALASNEIRVPIMSEEVVVEKRPVVKEEIVITKDVVTQTADVEADLRKERVDVHTTGDATTDTEVLNEGEPGRAAIRKGGSRG
jgi:uncharacterized protein (TIGR02271 family)